MCPAGRSFNELRHCTLTLCVREEREGERGGLLWLNIYSGTEDTWLVDSENSHCSTEYARTVRLYKLFRQKG